ncbi:MAG: glycosyltransferase family 9 protein [Sedimenticola sp.]
MKFLSFDSGLLHVAAALDRPLLAVYGYSDPCFTLLLNGCSCVLSLGLECNPCFERECATVSAYQDNRRYKILLLEPFS